MSCYIVQRLKNVLNFSLGQRKKRIFLRMTQPTEKHTKSNLFSGEERLKTFPLNNLRAVWCPNVTSNIELSEGET